MPQPGQRQPKDPAFLSRGTAIQDEPRTGLSWDPDRFRKHSPHPKSSGVERQKHPHTIELHLELSLERAIAWWGSDIAELRFQATVLHRQIGPADHAVTP